jgi:hypothetical protein
VSQSIGTFHFRQNRPCIQKRNQDIGSAIAIFGEQVVATVCVTYAIESSVEETADVSAFFAFLRQLYVFVGQEITNLNFSQAARRPHHSTSRLPMNLLTTLKLPRFLRA